LTSIFILCFLFFFSSRRRHTRFSRDWSSDVCSSDLAKVFYVLKEFPKMRILIESHTDSRGSDDYNLSLSNTRAENTKRYLIANGVERGRIEGARGFGEKRLLNRCSNGVRCSDEDHAINRRSNFIIIQE